MDKLIYIVVGSILVNNYVLSRFLGICPFLGVSRKVETAFGMGVAVTFVMTLASVATWMAYNLALEPLTNALGFNFTFLYNIAFILIIAALVQFVEMFMKKSSPTLYRALGVYLPLITTNCAVLGVTVINMNEGYGLLYAALNGMCAALGFTLTIVLFAGIRERLERNDILPHFLGFPIALITAGLMSIAFFGFSGIIK